VACSRLNIVDLPALHYKVDASTACNTWCCVLVFLWYDERPGVVWCTVLYTMLIVSDLRVRDGFYSSLFVWIFLGLVSSRFGSNRNNPRNKCYAKPEPGTRRASSGWIPAPHARPPLLRCGGSTSGRARALSRRCGTGRIGAAPTAGSELRAADDSRSLVSSGEIIGPIFPPTGGPAARRLQLAACFIFTCAHRRTGSLAARGSEPQPRGGHLPAYHPARL
jgi:hypothetical protein